MIAAFVALAAVVAPIPADLAGLRLDVDGTTIAVAVHDTPRKLTIDCVERCRMSLHFTDPVGDEPLGVFRLGDTDGLVVTLWAGGSAYRVRVYQVRARDVHKVLEASTLSAPQFLTSPGGVTVIRTTERGDRDPPGTAAHVVSWTWQHGRFVRR